MVIAISNNRKYVKYDGTYLYFKVDGIVRKLGLITTHKGALTRQEKLKAVACAGKWIEI